MEIIKEPTRTDRVYVLMHRLNLHYVSRSGIRPLALAKQPDDAVLYDGGPRLDLFLEKHPIYKAVEVGGKEKLAKYRVALRIAQRMKREKLIEAVSEKIRKAKEENESL